MTSEPARKSARRSAGTAKRQRRYLPGVERKREILGAALVEFSDLGFSATTIERIAARAGLSKAGIYAHYKSKDEVFEDLLMSLLVPREIDDGGLSAGARASLSAIVESYVGQLYARLDDPLTESTFRLLVAESRRAPSLIRRWYFKAVEIVRLQHQAVVDECVRRGVMRKGVLTDHFMLATAPFVLWMVMHMLLDDEAPMSREQMRAAHKRLLLDLLRPR